jgi:hypothetical protein
MFGEQIASVLGLKMPEWKMLADVDWHVKHAVDSTRLSFSIKGQEVFWLVFKHEEAAKLGAALKGEGP